MNMRTKFELLMSAFLTIFAVSAARAQETVRYSFDDLATGTIPDGIEVDGAGWSTVVADTDLAGDRMIRLTPLSEFSSAQARAVWAMDATPYRGRTIRVAAALRPEAGADGWMALRVRRTGNRIGFADETDDVLVNEGQWRPVDTVGFVADDATTIEFMVVAEGGALNIDEVRFEVVEATTKTPADDDASAFVAARHLARPGVRRMRFRSSMMSTFFGRDVFHHAMIVAPVAKADDAAKAMRTALPVVYVLPDLDERHWDGVRGAHRLLASMASGETQPHVRVYLDAIGPMGHHGFRDSVNAGPNAEAFMREVIATVEAASGGERSEGSRFLLGTGRGGRSALGLAAQGDKTFARTWCLSPDLFDRSFLTSAPQLKQFVGSDDRGLRTLEITLGPKGPDGAPTPILNRETNTIDDAVRSRWLARDVVLAIEAMPRERRADFAQRVRVFVGADDSRNRDAASRRIAKLFAEAGIATSVIVVDGRDENNLGLPHPTAWVDGLTAHLRRELRDAVIEGATATPSDFDDIEALLAATDAALDVIGEETDPGVQPTDHASSCGHDHSHDGHNHNHGQSHSGDGNDGSDSTP